jgi:hypothetical protein
MSFWDWWESNRQKTLGSVVTFFSVVGGLIAADAFDKLLSDTAVGWLGIACAVVTGVAGSATIRSAFQNTTQERVAEAAATIAVAQASTAATIESALQTPPPAGGKV